MENSRFVPQTSIKNIKQITEIARKKIIFIRGLRSIRGKGYGTQMLKTGLNYAFNILGVEIVTIGVFESNVMGHECYKKAGFADKSIETAQPYNIVEMEISKDDYLRKKI